MLRGIHKASSTWVGKAVMAVIMGFLVISFAIWGIGDIFRGYGRNDVAKIGSTEISIEQFREYYNDRIQRISRQLGKPISSDQARALGLDRQILGQMIAETTLDQQAKDMRLGLSDAAIANRIQTDPTFNGPDGKFSRQRFEEIIRNAGFTEARFVAEQRNVMLRRQIAQSISGDMRVPEIAVKAIDQYRNEKRDVDYLALGPDQAGTIRGAAAGDAEEILRRPQGHVPRAGIPQDHPALAVAAGARQSRKRHRGRGQGLLRAAQGAIRQAGKARGAPDPVSERSRRQSRAREDRRRRELRRHRQGARPEGLRHRYRHGDAGRDHRSGGRQGRLRAQERRGQPAGQRQFRHRAGDRGQDRARRAEELRRRRAPQIKKEIAERKARSKIGELRDKIEDEKASGATLAEAGKKLGLKTRVIDAVDRAGNGPDGKPVADLPSNPNVVNAAFSSDVGVDNEALQLPSGGFLYYDVNGITPSHERAYDTVKDKVESHWRDDEIAKRLKTKADAMLAKLKAGGTLKALADANKLQVQTAKDVQRGKPGFAPPRLVQAAFATPKDVPGVTQGQKETEYYVFKVTKVTEPKFEPAHAGGPLHRRAAAERLCRRRHRRLHRAGRKRDGRQHQSDRVEPGGRRRPTRRLIPCRSSRRKPNSPNAMSAANRRWFGPRWSPTWKRRFPPSSSSAAASR